MAQVRAFAPSGITLKFQLLNNLQQRGNNSSLAFETYNAAHFSNYNVALVEQGSSGVYVGTVPTWLIAGVYGYVVYSYIGSGGQTEADYQFLENGTVDTTTGSSSSGSPVNVINFSPAFTFQKTDIGIKFNIQFVNEDGTPFNISSASQIKIYLMLPDGSKKNFNGAFLTDGTDGFVTWTNSLNTDLSQAGTYQIQAFVVYGGTNQKFSEVQPFEVDDNVGP